MELLKQPQKPMKLISSTESVVNKMYPFQNKSREIEFPNKYSGISGQKGENLSLHIQHTD